MGSASPLLSPLLEDDSGVRGLGSPSYSSSCRSEMPRLLGRLCGRIQFRLLFKCKQSSHIPTHTSLLTLAEQPGYLRNFMYFAILKYISAFHGLWMRKLRLWEGSEDWSLRWASQWEFEPLTHQTRVSLSESAGCVDGPLPKFRSEVLRSHMGFSPNQPCPPFHLRPGTSLLEEGPGCPLIPQFLNIWEERGQTPPHSQMSIKTSA